MDAIKLSIELENEFINYLSTIFDVNRDEKHSELAIEVRESLEKKGALVKGPFLELNPPYKTGKSLKDLVEEGVLSKKLLNLECFKSGDPIPIEAKLYTHQERSIRKLCEAGKSVVISSGTGSGKTECFLLPILNDLLLDPEPGVRALLIYPMNALVNDQLDRLRVILKGTNITFGRYTSELPDQPMEMDYVPLPNEVICRSEIHSGKKLPQILITNYAMLEYLLLRPEDSLLFSKGNWKYLVLDEAHTYTGAQGIEVSMLIRRLKQRLGKKKKDMLCVATSATLTDSDFGAAAEFASTLFYEEIGTDCVFFGEIDEKYIEERVEHYFVDPKSYLHKDMEIIIDLLEKNDDIEKFALAMNLIGLLPDKYLKLASESKLKPTHFLYDVFSGNVDLINFRTYMLNRNNEPIQLEDAASIIFSELMPEDQILALFRLVEIGALAKPFIDQPPLLPARYHLFMRPPQGLWICLNPKCSGRKNDTPNKTIPWSRIYSEKRDRCGFCGCLVYPLYICRQCGQTYIGIQNNGFSYIPRTENLFANNEARYFNWGIINEMLYLAEEEAEDSEDQGDQTNKYFQSEISICLNCGNFLKHCKCDNKTPSTILYQMMESSSNMPIKKMNECPRCRSKSKEDTDIATEFSVYGANPLSILTYELYRNIPESNIENFRNKPGGGRKLLTFYDSRQGAAKFAAFMQDVANKQNYRHIIPKSLSQLERQNDDLNVHPDIDLLSDQCFHLAWENRIFQNDPDQIDFWQTKSKELTQSEKKQLKTLVKKQILAEFTTGKKIRQSLESLGIVGIEYFEKDKERDLKSLADKIGLNSLQSEALIGYLLDDICYKKAIVLPQGIDRDDPVFGTNKGNPKIIRQGNANRNEIRWIGATERQLRRRYIKLVLDANGLPNSNEDVCDVLNSIWDWIIEKTDIFEGDASSGYQLSLRHLFFSSRQNWYRCTKCQRLYYRGSSLPCPHPHCGGQIISIDIQNIQENNYFYHLFKKDIIPIRTEEHTAQLSPEKGREYQKFFKNGNINLLSCSTTFEMGIDLGDLQSVVMCNVPPSVANYRQRSGRAGRRLGGTAFILTWTANRPHDQSFFNNPIEIIKGEVCIPKIKTDNLFIVRRHLNAVLLSEFLRYRKSKGASDWKFAGSFFDRNGDSQISYLPDWIETQAINIKNIIKDFSYYFEQLEDFILNFSSDDFLRAIKEVDANHYQYLMEFYISQHQLAKRKYSEADNSKIEDLADKERRKYAGYIERLRKEYLIDYLSKRGVLPSYSFPIHSVELFIPNELKNSEHLRLERDIKLAIREYAPGAEIVADKRIWTSQKPIFFRNNVKENEYVICKKCNFLTISKDIGIPLDIGNGHCPICGDKFPKIRKFIEPDAFRADPKKSGKPAKQYVKFEQNDMRSALLPIQITDETNISDNISIVYQKAGKLLYVNEGNFGKGFNLDLTSLKDEEKSLNIVNASLGHIRSTNTLHLHFRESIDIKIPPPSNRSFWLSMMYALIHGACHALQIERGDIDGVLSPRQLEGGSWEQTIVLYDNVPGGAGYVKNIQDNIEKVIDQAVKIVNCTDCALDTSCYRCLRDYNNQFYHNDLKRGNALRVLEAISASLQKVQHGIPGECYVASSNLTIWFLRQIESTKNNLEISIHSISSKHPLGDNYSWFDTFNDLLLKKVQINLYIEELELKTSEQLASAQHLQILQKKGLKLWRLKKISEWSVVIDSNNEQYQRAIKFEEINHICLDDVITKSRILTTIHPEGISKALKSIYDSPKLRITPEDLNPPPNVNVVVIPRKINSDVTEEKLFGDIFNKPTIELSVYDPYLLTNEVIEQRLGEYIRLASQPGQLRKVLIFTRKAGQGFPGNDKEQEYAENQIIRKYGNIVVFKHNYYQHDRFIEILRLDGTKARIIIGRGLDFIQPDRSTKPTFVIIEDPFT
jgi:superfamily II DNA/RNA helicase